MPHLPVLRHAHLFVTRQRMLVMNIESPILTSTCRRRATRSVNTAFTHAPERPGRFAEDPLCHHFPRLCIQIRYPDTAPQNCVTEFHDVRRTRHLTLPGSAPARCRGINLSLNHPDDGRRSGSPGRRPVRTPRFRQYRLPAAPVKEQELPIIFPPGHGGADGGLAFSRFAQAPSGTEQQKRFIRPQQSSGAASPP